MTHPSGNPAPQSLTQRVHACLECGIATKKSGDFCSAACRSDFNNRRKRRGAELYDLYMAHRFDRANAVDLGIFQAINRLASNYRQEDHSERNSRRSWRSPAVVMEERPFLKSVSTRIRSGR